MLARKVFLAIGQVGAAVGLSVGAMQVLAQDEGETEPRATPVGTSFSYQGRVDVDGVPYTGTCNVTFELWDASVGGALVGTQAVAVNATNGLFSTVLNSAGQFGTSAFTGSARWIELTIGCGGQPGIEIIGRTELTAAPYALSIRPGSETFTDSTGAVLRLDNTNPSGEGLWSRADRAFFANASRIGLYVQDPTGDGVVVSVAEEDGVDAASLSASGYAGRFVNSVGSGVYAKGGTTASADIVLGGSPTDTVGKIITATTAGTDMVLQTTDDLYLDFSGGVDGRLIVRDGGQETFQVLDTGDLKQWNASFGVPKMAIRANCTATPSISRYDSSLMTPYTPFISHVSTGHCDIDAGFNLANFYIVATTETSGNEYVSVLINGDIVEVRRWDDGVADDGPFFLIIY